MISAPDGYKIVWYTDEAYRSMLDTDTMIEGNLTLYGRNEPADTVSYVRAEDPETLLSAYNDALLARQTTMQIFADYAYGTAQDLVNYFSQNALTLYTYDISINSFDQYNMTILISYSPIANSKTDTVLYTQLPSSNQTVRGSNRPADFDDFAINLVEPAYTVNNSEALYYVLENGMSPIIDENSPELADLYEKMKAVLRTCVDDDMSEAEKARAIYEYLILNTVYDGALFNAAQENHSALENNSFYLEGVFNDHLAVCDGISKAYLCLCRMEGLECVRINGKKAPDDPNRGQ